MKKLFLVFAISAFFVACGDGTNTTTEETTTTEDTTLTPETTEPVTTAPLDSTANTTDSLNVNPEPAQ